MCVSAFVKKYSLKQKLQFADFVVFYFIQYHILFKDLFKKKKVNFG